MAVNGLFTSCATPDTRFPTVAIFSACTSLACKLAASVMSVITVTMLSTVPCSPRIGLRFTENCPVFPSGRSTGISKLSISRPWSACSSASASFRRAGGGTRSVNGRPSRSGSV
jgi:hypothetical protein